MWHKVLKMTILLGEGAVLGRRDKARTATWCLTPENLLQWGFREALT